MSENEGCEREQTFFRYNEPVPFEKDLRHLRSCLLRRQGYGRCRGELFPLPLLVFSNKRPLQKAPPFLRSLFKLSFTVLRFLLQVLALPLGPAGGWLPTRA